MNHTQANYILFIDESGKSKLSDEAGRYFLLSGVIIDSNLHQALSNYMVSLKVKCNIPPDQNVHAFDIFENEKLKHTGRIKVGVVDKFFSRLLSLAHGADMHPIILRIDKKVFQDKLKKTAKRCNVSEKRVYKALMKESLHDFLYEAAARKMILEFGHFLEGKNAVGEIIAESRRLDDAATLRAFVDATSSSKFRDGTNYRLWSEYSFRRIHSLTFQNKKGLSFGLEMADMFAWADYNSTWGIAREYTSQQKIGRIKRRITQVNSLRSEITFKNSLENLTTSKINTVAGDRVSELSKFLDNVEFS